MKCHQKRFPGDGSSAQSLVLGPVGLGHAEGRRERSGLRGRAGAGRPLDPGTEFGFYSQFSERPLKDGCGGRT